MIKEELKSGMMRTPLRLVRCKARLVRYSLNAFHIPGLYNINDYFSTCRDLKKFESPRNGTETIEYRQTERQTDIFVRSMSTNKRLLFEELKQKDNKR